MKNEPEKWQQQTWVIGYEPPRLQREENHWYIVVLSGVRIEVEEEWALRMVDYINRQAQNSSNLL